MKQLKKIMVVSRTGDHLTLKRLLLEALREKKIAYSKNEGANIFTEYVEFHFLSLNYRNLAVFRHTHKYMDKIYFLHSGIIEEIMNIKENKNGILDKLSQEVMPRGYWWHLPPVKAYYLMELVDHDFSRFDTVDNDTPAALLRELGDDIVGIVDVYEVQFRNTLVKKTILKKDFVKHKHYRTREEAVEVLKYDASEGVRRAKADLVTAEEHLLKVLELEAEGNINN